MVAAWNRALTSALAALVRLYHARRRHRVSSLLVRQAATSTASEWQQRAVLGDRLLIFHAGDRSTSITWDNHNLSGASSAASQNDVARLTRRTLYTSRTSLPAGRALNCERTKQQRAYRSYVYVMSILRCSSRDLTDCRSTGAALTNIKERR